MDYNKIENEISSTKKPLTLYLFYLKKYDDNECYYITRFFMKHHFDLFIKYEIHKLIDIKKEQTYNVIIKVNSIIKKQYNLIKIFKTFKYRNFFWKLKLPEQVEHLNKQLKLFRSHFDCSIGLIYFHEKIKVIINEKDQEQNTEEIFNRLKLVYKMFGIKFFQNNNINLISYEDFFDISFMGKVKYTEYIFAKINNILLSMLDKFTLYSSLQQELYNIVNPKIYKIKVICNEIDIDINF